MCRSDVSALTCGSLQLPRLPWWRRHTRLAKPFRRAVRRGRSSVDLPHCPRLMNPKSLQWVVQRLYHASRYNPPRAEKAHTVDILRPVAVEPMASASQLKMFPSSSVSNAQQCLAVCHFIRKDQQCRCRERLHRGRLLRIDLRLSTTGAQCSFVNTVQHEQALQFKPSKSAVMKTGQEKWLTDDSDCRISDLVEHSSAYLRLPRAEDVCWISQARPSIRSREMPYQFKSSSYQARP